MTKELMTISKLIEKCFNEDLTLTKDEAKEVINLFDLNQEGISIDWSKNTIFIKTLNTHFKWEDKND